MYIYIYIYSNTCCQSIWYTTSITFELFCSSNLPKNLNCCVCVCVRVHISYQNMKIYIHYIGTKAECQQVAIKLNITDDDNLKNSQEIISHFVKLYNKKQKKKKLNGRLNENEIKLKFNKTSKKFINDSIAIDVESGADIYAVDVMNNNNNNNNNTTKKKKKNTNNNNNNNNKTTTTTEKVNNNTTSIPPAPSTSKKNITRHSPATQETIKQLTIKAVDAFHKKALRAARISFETILQLDSNNLNARVGIAEIYLKNKKYSKMISILMPTPYSLSNPAPWSSNSKVLEYMGDAYYYMKQYKESLKAYDSSLHSILKEKNNGSSSPPPQITKEQKVHSILTLKVKMANVLYDAGEQDAGINIVQNIFKETEEFIPSLILYAKAAWERSQKAAAIQILLKGIVKDSENKLLREHICEMISADGGMKDLMETFVGETGSGLSSALAFLGTILKDHGKILSSSILYEKAIEATPSSASYALNLMHVYEIGGNFRKALSTAERFLKWNMYNGTKGIRSILDEDILLALSKLPHKTEITDDNGDDSSTTQKTKKTDESKKYPINTLKFNVNPNEFEIKWQSGDHSHAIISEPDDHTLPIFTPAMLKLASPEKKLTNEELDHIALYFTIVKILFCIGEIQVIPRLVYLIEIVRKHFSLHKTTVRNEHAYYCCIAQLLVTLISNDNKQATGKLDDETKNETTPSITNEKPIYICGDSHTLPLAWRKVKLQNQDCRLIPALATGVKAYHLRPESKFYPKVNFKNVTNKIPLESTVVFVFCEIDCREGILLAVEKDRYKDVDAGIRHVVEIYMKALEDLIAAKKFKAFIHPVIPVLNETRLMVIKFNKVLKEYVLKRNKNVMVWIGDFFDDLLDNNGMLKKEYELDGTHLSPNYIPLLINELERNM